MFDSSLLLFSASIVIGLAVILWLYSLVIRDVSIVDSLWSLMFLGAALVYLAGASEPDSRAWLVLGLVALWGLIALEEAWSLGGLVRKPSGRTADPAEPAPAAAAMAPATRRRSRSTWVPSQNSWPQSAHSQ